MNPWVNALPHARHGNLEGGVRQAPPAFPATELLGGDLAGERTVWIVELFSASAARALPKDAPEELDAEDGEDEEEEECDHEHIHDCGYRFNDGSDHRLHS